MERLAILDGYGYIFRAHYGLAYAGKERQGVRLTTSAGMPTGALHVYASMLVRLFLDVRPERIAVVFDAPGPTFRDELDAEYKANRSEMPDDLKAQMKYFRPLTEAFAWPVIAVPGVEADDVIATLVGDARRRGWDATIFSADKDLMQLVGDHVVVIDAMRQLTYDAPRVEEKFGVPPSQVGDFLALLGDSSDNVPGVAGVGKVTASKLLRQYGSIDGILAHVGELKGKLKDTLSDPAQLARLELSRKLVALRTDCELPVELDSLRRGEWDGSRLRAILMELEFNTLIERLEGDRGRQSLTGTISGPVLGGGAPVVTSPEGGAASAPSAEPVGGEPAAADAILVSEASSLCDLSAAVELLGTPEALAGFCAAARATGELALHVEPDGARSDRARLIGLGLATPGRAPAYLPLAHRYLGVPAQLGEADLAPLAALLADPAVRVAAHDTKELRKVLASRGLALATVAHDTMLAAYLIDSSTDAYDLGAAALSAIGRALPPRAELVGSGKNARALEAVPVDDAARWSGRAAAAVLDASPVYAERLERAGQGDLYRDLELPLAELLARLEETGIRVDLAHLATLSDRVSAQLAALERRIYEHAGGEINLGSPKQLGALLFDRLGLTSERMRKTKTGYSTDHEVLESLAELHPIVPPILEHREIGKLKSTYIDALPPLINPTSGRLHTSYRQAVAATGRLSSTDPNLQNIPIRSELGREIRRAFVAAPGTLLVAIDYSQIELRVLAHLSGDPVLTRAFSEGIDVHTQTAAEVFGIELAAVGDHERRVAKAVNYGLVYGQSDFGLGRALDIPRGEARHYIERYFERFSTVRSFMDALVAEARRTGSSTTILGRRRPIAGLTARDFRVRSGAERIAQNTPMQGSGADIMKLAMLRVDALLRRREMPAKILLTVHDELVLEVERGVAAEVAAEVAAVMTGVVELKVPLEVDVGIGENWADAA
jgi:DNA polymerase-1